MGDLLLPVGPRSMSSWASHQRRSPRSSEPGTDFFCPIGTPVLAPANGRIYGSGNTIGPATGRWVGVDLDNGMRFRALHLSSIRRPSGFVRRGEVLGWSGASGYGEEDWSWNVAETGGAHTHVTLWPTHSSNFGYASNGRPYTVDFMDYADTSGASGGGFFPAVIESEEDDMKLLYVSDDCDGNGRPGWVLLNTRTGNVYPPLVNDGGAAAQGAADRWAIIWGSSKVVVRQDMLNAIDAVQKTG